MINLVYSHKIGKNVAYTTKGFISVETVIPGTGKDICIFLERLSDKKKFSKRYLFTDFKSTNEVILQALKDFGNVL